MKLWKELLFHCTIAICIYGDLADAHCGPSYYYLLDGPAIFYIFIMSISTCLIHLISLIFKFRLTTTAILKAIIPFAYGCFLISKCNDIKDDYIYVTSSLMYFIPGIVLLVMNLCIARKGNYNNLKS